MKNFFTSLLGSLVALILFSVGCMILAIGFFAMLAAIGSAEKSAPAFERGSYLVFDLATNISDAPQPVDLGIFGGEDRTVQLRTVTRALRAAATDDRIAGVFITGDLSPMAYGSGYAALKEVRDALEAFKKSGKPIAAYLTHATTKSYYLASTANDLAIDPYGMILMPGLASEPMFFTGTFEKYGINVQMTRVGKYKSAVEPFTRKDMSPEAREEMQKLLGDLWNGILAGIAPSRNLTPDGIQTVIDREGVLRADVAKETGFVDRVVYRDQIYDDLKAKTGRKGSRQPFKQVTLVEYAKTNKGLGDLPMFEGVEAGGGSGKVAVVYAEGEIVDGEGEPDQIGGTRFSRELRKLRLDPSVKAIVLRVNSPGGSASASEVIQREVRLIKDVKPIVISMGSYAASGGYWISAYGDRIFAEANTITGSIGVFGLQFDVQKLANNFGLSFDVVKTGRYADAVTISRPKTPEELAIAQNMVDWIYDEFVKKVAEGRKLSTEAVQAIAQGRVWSGSDALERGLVDEIGGLDAAIAFAAQKAKLSADYRIVEYPREKELMEVIQELLDRTSPGIARSTGLKGQIMDRVERELKALNALNDPKGIYARLPMMMDVR